MAIEKMTADALFDHLWMHECSGTWEDHSQRGLSVEKVRCRKCFLASIEWYRNFVIATSTPSIRRAAWIQVAKRICQPCANLGRPTILPGGTRWHASTGGYVACAAAEVWALIDTEA